jgi:hypothetical protein
MKMLSTRRLSSRVRLALHGTSACGLLSPARMSRRHRTEPLVVPAQCTGIITKCSGAALRAEPEFRLPYKDCHQNGVES